MPANHAGSQEGRTLYAREIMEMFDHLIESSKIGIRKPNPRIYEMMCETLSVEPDACVYLDDLGMNLKPAKAMGMATIKVESGPQAIAELEKLLDMKLRLSKDLTRWSAVAFAVAAGEACHAAYTCAKRNKINFTRDNETRDAQSLAVSLSLS